MGATAAGAIGAQFQIYHVAILLAGVNFAGLSYVIFRITTSNFLEWILTNPYTPMAVSVWVLFLAYLWFGWAVVINKPVFITVSKNNKQIQKILARCKRIHQPPCPPFFLLNEHAQFLPWCYQGMLHMIYYPICYQRLEHFYPESKERAIIDVYPSFETDKRPLPIVILLAGLRGHSQDLPGTTLQRRFINDGRFRIVVDHRRGNAWENGDYLPLTQPEFHLMGSPEDLSSSIRHMRELYPQQAKVPTQICGISVGSGHLVTCLGKWAEMRKNGAADRYGYPPPDNIVGGIGAFPGYDISRCGLKAKFPYNRLLPEIVKGHFYERNKDVLIPGIGQKIFDEAMTMKSLQDVNDLAYAVTKCTDAEDYYQKYNPIRALIHVDVPLLAINPLDDPVTTPENCLEVSPYPEFKGLSYRQACEQGDQPMVVCMPACGSHCPGFDGGNFDFFEKSECGVWMFKSWFDDVMIEFCAAVLDDLGHKSPGSKKKK